MKKETVLAIIIVGISMLYATVFYFTYTRAEQQHFNSFEVVTGLGGLILSIVATYYVYNAYITQKEQIDIQRKEIEDNRRDVEYDRALSLVYKQLEYSKNSFDIFRNRNVTASISNIYEMFTKITHNLYKLPLGEYHKFNDLIEYLRSVSMLLTFLAREFKIYNTIISNDKLTEDKKIFLITLITDNIEITLHKKIGEFQYVYRNLKQTGKIDNLRTTHTVLINSIEHKLSCVLGYFMIKKYEDLDLGE